jgi:2-iminobutanoate/2-iminopropanoate deaminase
LYGEAFQKDFPARTCVEVSKLPLGAAIEIECVAVKD